MKILVISSAKVVGEVMAAWEVWPADKAEANSRKYLNELRDNRLLEQGRGYFRLPGCRSEYKSHAQLETKAIAEVLKRYPDSLVFREATLQKVMLRIDVIALIKKADKGRLLIIECVETEPENYLTMKINTLMGWQGALPFLTNLTGHQIPSYEFCVYGDSPVDGVPNLLDVLKEEVA